MSAAAADDDDAAAAADDDDDDGGAGDDAADDGGQGFPFLYIQTPDRPPQRLLLVIIIKLRDRSARLPTNLSFP